MKILQKKNKWHFFKGRKQIKDLKLKDTVADI